MNSRHKLRFDANGKFTVMQISDVQDMGGLMPRTQKLYLAALNRVRPDFVVFTGDQFKGYGLGVQLANDAQRRRRVQRTIDALAGPLKVRRIPFTITFGNHDHDVPMDPLEQIELWQRWPNCLTQHSGDVPGYANHVLEVTASVGDSPALLMYFLDSHASKSWGYLPLEAGQIEWYRQTRDSYGHVPSMLFQHVPIEELYELYKQVEKNTPGSFEGFRNYKGKHYAIDKTKIAPGGFMGELPSCPDENAGLFDAALEQGEMLGMFFGHDHNNGFHGDVRGIQLGYAPAAGYSAYGPGRKRGVRVFHFDEHNLAGFESYVLTDEQLLGSRLLNPLVRMQDATPSSWGEAELRLRRDLPRISLAAAGISVGLAAVRVARKKR